MCSGRSDGPAVVVPGVVVVAVVGVVVVGIVVIPSDTVPLLGVPASAEVPCRFKRGIVGASYRSCPSCRPSCVVDFVTAASRRQHSTTMMSMPGAVDADVVDADDRNGRAFLSFPTPVFNQYAKSMAHMDMYRLSVANVRVRIQHCPTSKESGLVGSSLFCFSLRIDTACRSPTHHTMSCDPIRSNPNLSFFISEPFGLAACTELDLNPQYNEAATYGCTRPLRVLPFGAIPVR